MGGKVRKHSEEGVVHEQCIKTCGIQSIYKAVVHGCLQLTKENGGDVSAELLFYQSLVLRTAVAADENL